MKFNLLFCFTILFTANIFAQYIPVNNIPFTQWGESIEAPLTGGLSAAQFSEIDLNNDGKQDLFVYDRGGWNYFCMINNGAGSYTYAPEYNTLFPHMEDWVLLRDYNCDNIPDIFTYFIGSTKVYTGIISAGVLSFELAKETLKYTDDTGGEIALYTSRTDIPSIDDIDNDGDMDILSFSVSNSTIRFYKNISVESGYACDSLIYVVDEYCWGEMYEGFSCGGGTLHVSCKGALEDASAMRMHIGSTIVTFDKNGDGDADAVLGDNSCNNLIYYRNGGSAEYAEMDDKDSTFPKNTVQFDMATFPAAFLIDADNDGDEDLLATTNDDMLGLNTQHVWLYENLNTNDTFDFVFKTDTFLINQMVDAGGYSKPVFFDYNNDNLLDIVLGVGNTYGKDYIFFRGLWLYKNIGTATSPAYELITRDFGNLAQYNFNHLAPAFADIDNDGDEDMLCGISDGMILYLENLSGPTGEATFEPIVYPYQAIDVGAFSSPFLIDIDGDALLDMISGEQNGNLNYYRNTGTATEPLFTLENDIWGGVDVRKSGFITGYSMPFLYRNQNDSLYLLVGSQSGFVFEFNELEIAPEGEFFLADTAYLTNNSGFYSTIQGADINNDGSMDFVCGNVRGGLMIFEKDMGTAIADPNENNTLFLFPNPASELLHIQTTENYLGAELKIYSSTGSLVFTQKLYSNKETIFLQNIKTSGIYLVTLTGINTFASTSFILLK